jgi:hypothetical protein
MTTETAEERARREVEEDAPLAETPEAVKAQEIFVQQRVAEIEEAEKLAQEIEQKVRPQVEAYTPPPETMEAAKAREMIIQQKIQEEMGKKRIVPLTVGTKTGKPITLAVTQAIRDLEKSNPRLYKTLVEEGIDPYQKAVAAEQFAVREEARIARRIAVREEARIARRKKEEPPIEVSEAEYQEYLKDIKTLKPFLAPSPFITSPRLREYITPSYDVAAAVKAGKSNSVRRLFGTEVYQNAKRTIAAENAVKPYTDKEGNIDVAAAIAGGVGDRTLEILLGKRTLEDIKHKLKGYLVTPTPKDTKIPLGLPSDKEYRKLSAREKLQLAKKGDLRAIYGVTTWYSAIEAHQHHKLWQKELKDIKQSELMEMIAAPYGRVATEVSRIRIPKVAPENEAMVKGIAHGVGDVAMSIATMPVIVGTLASMGTRGKFKQTGATATAVGTGIYSSGKEIVIRAVKDPYYGVPYAVVTLAPTASWATKKLIGVGKKITVYAHRKGIPIELTAKEFSTGKITTSKLPKDDLGTAVGQALESAMKPDSRLSGEITYKGITVRYLKTAYQSEIGNALWHGTQDFTSLAKQKKIRIGEAGLYFDPYLAESFATGKQGGFLLLLTNTRRLKETPPSILKKISQSDWYIRQQKEGLHLPSKLWRGDFETEIVAKGTLKVPKPTSSLFNRLFMGKVGDFFTYSSRESKFKPIKIAYDSRIFDSPPTPAELYALKTTALRNALANFSESLRHPFRSLGDIVKGRIGTKGLREMEVTRIDIELMRGVNKLKLRLQRKALNKTLDRVKRDSPRFEEVYHSELNKVFRDEAFKLQRQYGKRLETVYDTRLGRERFENLYRYALQRYFRAYARYRISNRRLVDTQFRVREDLHRRQTRTPVERARTRAIIARRSVRDIRETYRPRPERRIRAVTEPIRTIRGVRVRRPIRLRPPIRERLRDRERIRERTPIRQPPVRVAFRPREKEDRRPQPRKRQIPIAWRQGFVWWVIYPPYKSKANVKVLRKPPVGAKVVKGVGSAYKTIQGLVCNVDILLILDMGIFDVTITRPKREPRKASIRYRRDIKQRTRSDISLTGVRV